jgi:hypothetical protein
MDNKYNNSKIYKIEPICDYEEGEIYIGSTCEKYLSNRMSGHRANYKRWLNGLDKTKCKAYDLFDKYGINNCQIILLEMINAESKEEVLAKESYYIRTLKCVNITIPDRTPKEWHHEYYQKNKEKYSKLQKEYYIVNKEYIDKRNKEYGERNKEQLSKYHEQYREEHKEHKKEIDKAYREANKEKIKERKTQPFLCECGCTIKWDEKARHKKTQKHINLMSQKEEQK